MIADLHFGPPDGDGIRPAHFVPRPSIPLAAACLVANGVRETLRDLFGEACELCIGEPGVLGPAAWETLSRDAYCFVTPGRQTDIVLVVPYGAARRLVLRAFGEAEHDGASALSALEVQAIERIAARCAAAFDALCAERRGASQRVARGSIPHCVAYFDVRVSVPIAFELGVGIVRDLPDPGPSGRTLSPPSLATVPIEVRAELAQGTIPIMALLALAPGDVIPLAAQGAGLASVKIGERIVATGAAGVANGRYSIEVRAVGAV